MTDSCKSCRFWFEHPVSQYATTGRCRRGPPSGHHEWPGTQPDDWCGEFEPKEAAEAPWVPHIPTWVPHKHELRDTLSQPTCRCCGVEVEWSPRIGEYLTKSTEPAQPQPAKPECEHEPNTYGNNFCRKCGAAIRMAWIAV